MAHEIPPAMAATAATMAKKTAVSMRKGPRRIDAALPVTSAARNTLSVTPLR